MSDTAAEYDVGDSLIARYDNALGLVARIDVGGNEAFYTFDALGNTRNLTGAGGTILNTYDYDAFGGVIVENETIANVFRFVGQQGVINEIPSLHFMRARFYSGTLGRFISSDPLNITGGDLNCLNYVHNNPVHFIDPLGTLTMEDMHRLTTQLRDKYPDNRNIQRANHYFENRLNMAGSEDVASSVIKAAWWAGLTVAWAGLKNAIVVANEDFLKPMFGEEILPNDLPFMNEPEQRNHWITADWGEVGAGLWGVWDGMWDFSPPKRFLPDGPLAPTGPIAPIPVVRPRDPNDKIGPAGIGPNRVVSTNDFMEYMVRFENATNATAPVQELFVVDYLSTNLDWSTVEFLEVGYGDRVLTPPAGTFSFTIKDRPPTNSPTLMGVGVTSMAVNVSGWLNPQIGLVEWRVSTVDTNTGYFPLDALTGILPPNDASHRGEGYMKFRVKPKADTPVGTVISNTASIVFDTNEPIETPPIWNMVGDIPSLAAVIAYLPGDIRAGTPFNYSIGLTNTGSATVTNVVLTNSLPTGAIILSATATVGTVSFTNNILFWYIGDMTNGAAANLNVTAVMNEGGTFTNSADFSGGSGLAIISSPSGFNVTSVSPPSLAIRINGGSLVIAWPTNSTGFALESTTNLMGSVVWTPFSNAPVSSGIENVVSNSVVEPQRFYKLRKP